MAEIGIASGLITLAGFSIKATTTLIQTLRSYDASKRDIRELGTELSTLTDVLHSVEQICQGENDTLPAVKYPVLECGKACEEFNSFIQKHAPRSSEDRRSFRDWVNMRLRGDSVDAFKQKIAANKSTILIALADANLRTSKVTAKLVQEYKDLIKNTTSDLYDRLDTIIAEWEATPNRALSDFAGAGQDGDRLIEEIKSTKQCLKICTEVSEHLYDIRPTIFESISTSESGVDLSSATITGHVSASSTTRAVIDSCKENLTEQLKQLKLHLAKLTLQYQALQSQHGDEEGLDSEKKRMEDEIESTKQSLTLCTQASARLDHNRLNIYEEVSVDADGDQYVISTIGDLISAKNVRAGPRALQVMGQLSDESFQKAVARPRSNVIQPEKSQSTPNRKFHGAGFTLNKPSQAGEGASS